MKQVFNVLEIFGWDVALLCFLFNIPALKLLNYIREDKLPTEVGNRLRKIVELYAYGYYLCNSRWQFNNFMRTPMYEDRVITPIALLNTNDGIVQVKMAIQRLEYGIF